MIWNRVRRPPLRRFRLAAGIGLGALFLYLAVGTVDTARAVDSVLHIRLVYVVIGLGLLCVGYSIRIVRWWLLLRSINPDVDLRACGRALVIGFSVNNLIPFRAGDVLRAFGFRQELGASPGQVLGTLAIERVLDLLALLAFFFVGLSQIRTGVLPGAFVTVALIVGTLGLAGSLLVTMWPAATRARIHRIAEAAPIARRGLARRIAAVVVQMGDALLALESRRTVLTLVGLSLLIWLVEGAVFAMIAIALSIDATPLGGHFAMATGTLATTIPSTPGYVGTFDLLTRLGLQAFGVSAVTAAAFALTVHVLLWLPVTAAGLLVIVSRGTVPSSLMAFAQSERSTE